MKTFAQKKARSQQESSTNFTRANAVVQVLSQPAKSLLHLQRTMGNQAVALLPGVEADGLDVTSHFEARTRFAHDFSRIPLHAPAPITIQPKLAINTPGDIYEQEADHVAEQVMRMSAPNLVSGCASGGGCSTCQSGSKENGHQSVQTKHVGPSDVRQVAAPPIVHEVLASPGQPLDASTRAFMEPRFGHDFSHVRVHSGQAAEESARQMNARAYTLGQNIVFGADQYAPTTAPGRRLLAHELAHSVQQGFASPTVVQRDEASAPGLDLPQTEEVHVPERRVGFEGDDLRNTIEALVAKKVTNYVTYRDAISKAFPWEKQFALNQVLLLSELKNILGLFKFAQCVELLGRRAPGYDELRKSRVVLDEISAAWRASDVGVHDRVTEAHEEGGWVFMNLIDGSLSTVRATPQGTNFIVVEPPPEVDNSVLVAIFHTHPHLGRFAKPSRHDRTQDDRRGVPNLVAGSTGADPKVFQVYLSGPPARKHLASEYRIPGPSGGDAP